MYAQELEDLIEVALSDGNLTDKKRQVLFRKAESLGIDHDEFEMYLDAKVAKIKATEVPQPAPASNKYGDVKKCPACGALIQSFSTKCPECGYEFQNIKANSSIQKLMEQLDEIEIQSGSNSIFEGMFASTYGDKKFRRKKQIIENFPIPTTKEDILEFLCTAVPLANSKGKNRFNTYYTDLEIIKVWKNKCEQIIMKAKFSMKDDSKALAEIKQYADELDIRF